jgi:hypothetical protein
MKANVKNATIVKEVELATIPNGQYPGTWGGYKVVAEINDELYEFDVDNGIRTNSAPCTIYVINGVVTVAIN